MRLNTGILIDAIRRNPYPLYRVLRRVRPVLHIPRPGIWALFDYDSVRRAIDDTETFSSRAAPPGGGPLDWLLFLDAPRHTRLRGLISRRFTPRMIADLEPRITFLAHSLLDAALAKDSFDLVRDYSEQLPLMVIAEMVGMPLGDASRVGPWSDAMIHLGDTIMGGERGERAKRNFTIAKDEMRAYLRTLLAERRTAPAGDLLSQLAVAEVDGERLGEDDILSFFQLLLSAGTETTTSLISNAVLCLLEHPQEFRRVRASPELIPAMLEEVLRYRSPVQLVFRMTRTDVTLRGQTIPAGQLVLPAIGSANRDPLHFARADRFEFTESRAPHLGLGHGVHYCLGAALARLEARVAIAVLFERTRDLRRATRGAWTPRPGLNVYGPGSLPVVDSLTV